MSKLDFEEVVDSNKPEGQGLQRLQALVDEADFLDSQMDNLNAQLSTMAMRYNHIKTHELPNLMNELQTDRWDSSAGTQVKMDSFVSGSLPKEEVKRKEAISHLIEVGGEALIKSHIEIEFSKSQHNEALALAEDIRSKGYAVNLSSGANAQSLMAFVREALRSGKNIDLPKLGIFSGRIAKITHAGKNRPTKAKKSSAKVMK